MNSIGDIKTGKAEPWAALQLAAYYRFDQFDPPELSFDEEQHIYTFGCRQYPSVTQILQAEGFINAQWYDDWSRAKGKFVHLAIKYYLAKELNEETLDPEIIPYLNAFKKFMAESGFTVTRSELSGINFIHHYAGTLDLAGNFPATIKRRFALELNKEGKYKLIFYDDKNDFAVWQAAVAVFHWKKNNLRRK